MNIETTKKLNNGKAMPVFGLGVFLSKDGEETANAVQWALEAGYRHIDTARIYRNEKSVREGIKRSGIRREDIFITTKLWNDDMRKSQQMVGFEHSLKDLGTDYVDLYLIHWPVGNIAESWAVLEDIYKSGRAKAIGVSNFQIHHLEDLLKKANVTPAVNQFESHPLLTQVPLIEYCKSKGIASESYYPLGGQGSDLMQNPVIVGIAEKHNKTAAQILLRWSLQRDVITIPKSVKKERIISNSQLYDFELSAEDMAEISGLNADKRLGADPDNVNF